MVARRSVLAALAASPWLLRGRGLYGDDLSRRAGGPQEITSGSKRSMREGNSWMKRAFNRDHGCGVDIGTPSDISCTAMVGLAMMSQGTSLYEGEMYRLVRDTQQFTVDVFNKGWFTVNLRTQVKADLSGYSDHHFGALLLSQSLGQGGEDHRVRAALNKLVQQIAHGQTREGHWGQGRYPLLGAVTGWVSLRGAYDAGLDVQASSAATAKLLYDSLKKKTGELFTLAAGIRVLFALDQAAGDIADWAFETAIRQARGMYFTRMGGEHFLALHFINEAMLQQGGDHWTKWYPMVRDKLINAQNQDGSWTGHSCITSRTFCTACAMLVLSSPNRYLPISEF